MTENLPGQARVVVVGVIGCGVAYHLTLAGGSYGVRDAPWSGVTPDCAAAGAVS